MKMRGKQFIELPLATRPLALIEEDIEFLSYDYQRVALFAREPLTITVPGFPSRTVGNGLGGFSHTMFTRSGRGCTMCGSCCGHRRTWWWSEAEPHPDPRTDKTVKGELVIVNGVEVPMLHHITLSGQRGGVCDYLKPWTDGNALPDETQIKNEQGDEIWSCRLYGKREQPMHCQWEPFLSPRTVRTARGPKVLLSRRLMSRNWAWPKCPVPVYSSTITPEDIEDDRRLLQQLVKSYSHIPGVEVERGYETWEKLVRGPAPATSVLLEDLWSE